MLICADCIGAVCLAFALGVAGRTGRTVRVAVRRAPGTQPGCPSGMHTHPSAALSGVMSIVLVAVICATSTSAVSTGGWWITAMGGNIYATTVASIMWSRRIHPIHRPSDPHRRVSDGDDDEAWSRRLSQYSHMCTRVWGVMGSNMPWEHRPANWCKCTCRRLPLVHPLHRVLRRGGLLGCYPLSALHQSL